MRVRLICASDVYSMCIVCLFPSDTNMCRKCSENCLKCTSYSICTECKVDTRWNKFSDDSWINSSANIALSSSAAENTDAQTLSAVLLQLVRATILLFLNIFILTLSHPFFSHITWKKNIRFLILFRKINIGMNETTDKFTILLS